MPAMIRYLDHWTTAAPLNCRKRNKNLYIQEAFAIFEELPSDDDSAASNNSDTDDEDYVDNTAQGENIFSDDEETDEIQCPSTSLPEVKWDKLYKK
ncbi:hypothetical protein TNCV_3151461 [Trichonephila clavipes]|nr:hypothetical protein TNCV_3151461 [Trichonephila clavipes]